MVWHVAWHIQRHVYCTPQGSAVGISGRELDMTLNDGQKDKPQEWTARKRIRGKIGNLERELKITMERGR